MAKRLGAIELLLKLINFIFTVCGLGIGLYGIYCLINWNKDTTHTTHHNKYEIFVATHASNWLSNKLPMAWFVYILLIVGASLIVISCFGCVGAAARSPCCLCFYSILLVLLFVAQLGAAAFMFFNRNWKQDVPHDISGRFNSTYNYLSKYWNIIRWITLGAFILEVIAVALALWLRSGHRAMSNSYGHERVNYVNGRPNNKRHIKLPAADMAPLTSVKVADKSNTNQNLIQ